jgi:hypothetical protein
LELLSHSFVFCAGLICGVTVAGVALIVVIVILACKMRLDLVLSNMWQYNTHYVEFKKNPQINSVIYTLTDHKHTDIHNVYLKSVLA